MGPGAMILVFWMLSFKPTFSLSSFHFHQEVFSSFSLSAIRVVSSAYLRSLIFLPAILIPTCASSSPAFLTMYSAFKLNKQGNNIQPWRNPSVQFSHSVVSDSLRPHGLQYARTPCPSPNPGIYSNSCPSSRWCHPTISSSVVPFSHLQSFPASASFWMKFQIWNP